MRSILLIAALIGVAFLWWKLQQCKAKSTAEEWFTDWADYFST